MEDIIIINAVAMQTTGVGDYVYRVEQPSIAMGKIPGVMVITVSTLSPYFERLCMQADILILHLLTEHDLLPIVAERKRQHYTTIYEISDNFMEIHPGGAQGWFSDPVNTALALQLIQICDAVQVTGDGILERYSFLNPDMIIFENQAAKMGRLHEPKSNLVTIGWGGSYGHRQDLKYISPVIQKICQRYPFAKFSFMGDEALYTEFFSSIAESQKIYTKPGSLEDYLCFLDTLDIGIAPMLDNPFNHCRSDVKFLEYASRGVVPVLSSITPYLKHASHRSNAFLFSDQGELKDILKELVQNTTLREETASNAYGYVKHFRLEDLHAEERIDFYKKHCKRRPSKDTEKLRLLPLSKESNAYNVEKTQSEIMLYRGVKTEASGNVEEARSLYIKAHELMYNYYLPLFWLGYSYMRKDVIKAVEYFEKTLNKNPRSLRSLLYMGNLHAKHDKKKALQAYEVALVIFPLYAPALESIGLLFEEEGDLSQALEFYDAALKVNPFYSKAASGLGRIYSILGDIDKAFSAFQVAADMAPLHLESQYQCAEYMLANGNLLEASKYCLRAMELDPHYMPACILMEKIFSLAGHDS
jgi:tetratricopeptide (TPR) repeat protein